MGKAVIGIDLGGTNINTIVVNGEGRVLGRDRSPSEAHTTPGRVMDNIAASARAALRKARLPLSCVLCVGVGTAGPVLHAEGIVSEAPNFRGWRNVRLASGLAKRLGRSVKVEIRHPACGRPC